MPAFILWGLRVIYRTLGNGVFFCRRCGGDRAYRHRAGRRYITVFFIPPASPAQSCYACIDMSYELLLLSGRGGGL